MDEVSYDINLKDVGDDNMELDEPADQETESGERGGQVKRSFSDMAKEDAPAVEENGLEETQSKRAKLNDSQECEDAGSMSVCEQESGEVHEEDDGAPYEEEQEQQEDDDNNEASIILQVQSADQTPPVTLEQKLKQTRKKVAPIVERYFPNPGHVKEILRTFVEKVNKRSFHRGYRRGHMLVSLETVSPFSGGASTNYARLKDPDNIHGIKHKDMEIGILPQAAMLVVDRLRLNSPELDKAICKVIADAVHETEIHMVAVADLTASSSDTGNGSPGLVPGTSQRIPTDVPTALNSPRFLAERKLICIEALNSILVYGFAVFAFKRQLDKDALEELAESEVFLAKRNAGSQSAAKPLGHRDEVKKTRFLENSPATAGVGNGRRRLFDCHVIPPTSGMLTAYMCRMTNEKVFHFTPMTPVALHYAQNKYQFYVYIPVSGMRTCAPVPIEVNADARPVDEIMAGTGYSSAAAGSSSHAPGASASGNVTRLIQINSPAHKVMHEWISYMDARTHLARVAGYNSFPLTIVGTTIDRTALQNMTNIQLAGQAVSNVSYANGIESDGSRLGVSPQVMPPQFAATSSQFQRMEDKKHQLQAAVEVTGYIVSTRSNASGELGRGPMVGIVGAAREAAGRTGRIRPDARPTPTDLISASSATYDDVDPEYMLKMLAAASNIPTDAENRFEKHVMNPPPETTVQEHIMPRYVGEPIGELRERYLTAILREFRVPKSVFESESSATVEDDVFSAAAPEISTRNAATLKYEMEATGYGSTIEDVRDELQNMWQVLFDEVVRYYDAQVIQKLFDKEFTKLSVNHKNMLNILAQYELDMSEIEKARPLDLIKPDNNKPRQSKHKPKPSPVNKRRDEKRMAIDPYLTEAEIIRLVEERTQIRRAAYMRHLNAMTIFFAALYANVQLSIEFRPSERVMERVQLRQKAAKMQIEASFPPKEGPPAAGKNKNKSKKKKKDDKKKDDKKKKKKDKEEEKKKQKKKVKDNDSKKKKKKDGKPKRAADSDKEPQKKQQKGKKGQNHELDSEDDDEPAGRTKRTQPKKSSK